MPDRFLTTCGNGSLQSGQGEQWDDGNNADGDGWSSTWIVEYGWTCANSPSVWSHWGNGVVANGEQCDDGNVSSGDGWSSSWTIEAGWSWSGAPSIWNRWGDLVIQGNEQCDDGNTINGDGWNSSCMRESGWTWKGSPSVWYSIRHKIRAPIKKWIPDKNEPPNLIDKNTFFEIKNRLISC